MSYATSTPRPRGCSAYDEAFFSRGKVDPAPAGMFPPLPLAIGAHLGRPRARGDVPTGCWRRSTAPASTPRPRGCSPLRTARSCPCSVDPAPAGMFPSGITACRGCGRRPRARGDVPCAPLNEASPEKSTPRPRGCSVHEHLSLPPRSRRPRARGDVPPTARWCRQAGRSTPRPRGCSGHAPAVPGPRSVDPAPAGMFPLCQVQRCGPAGRPRARGDVPPPLAGRRTPSTSTPRPRGCSRDFPQLTPTYHVDPAPAGMFPRLPPRSAHRPGRPRARGDVPHRLCGPMMLALSTPRPRGCSVAAVSGEGALRVDPAPAGMFPATGCCGASCRRRPRARGDVPWARVMPALCSVSTPRPRGCSRLVGVVPDLFPVDPAPAGMFRPTSPSTPAPPRRPRARGDAPSECGSRLRQCASTPRPRGCSVLSGPVRVPVVVDPAPAGMLR
ncbi:hypothetical protein SAMN05421870_105177 [Streptomyces qinglanensis]|uniref:Uncharacterized protein n=1 Tax=Streptomyces qinglanensis TaxID=943816 RepID=A0A1H9SXQ4_9ACTN|nr:hypothetical protein SAMN05421870_105177 [Streptomyces qinglanensis]